VTHQFGHQTPADVKLRQVARHAAAAAKSAGDDDDDDMTSQPAGHVTGVSDVDDDISRRRQPADDYYYEYESKRAELSRDEPLARVDSSNEPLARVDSSPSSISDVYFVGKCSLRRRLF